jgi:hypothetical protein
VAAGSSVVTPLARGSAVAPSSAETLALGRDGPTEGGLSTLAPPPAPVGASASAGMFPAPVIVAVPEDRGGAQVAESPSRRSWSRPVVWALIGGAVLLGGAAIIWSASGAHDPKASLGMVVGN